MSYGVDVLVFVRTLCSHDLCIIPFTTVSFSYFPSLLPCTWLTFTLSVYCTFLIVLPFVLPSFSNNRYYRLVVLLSIVSTDSIVLSCRRSHLVSPGTIELFYFNHSTILPNVNHFSNFLKCKLQYVLPFIYTITLPLYCVMYVPEFRMEGVRVVLRSHVRLLGLLRQCRLVPSIPVYWV